MRRLEKGAVAAARDGRELPSMTARVVESSSRKYSSAVGSIFAPPSKGDFFCNAGFLRKQSAGFG